MKLWIVLLAAVFAALAELSPGAPAEAPAAVAEVRAVAGRVERKPLAEEAWTPLRAGDAIGQRDTIRAEENASASLAFTDGASLVLAGPASVVLPGAPSGRTRAGDDALRLVTGQADIVATEAAAGPPFDLALGDLRVRARAEAKGGTHVRARRTAEGRVELMLYAGTAELVRAGAAVRLSAASGIVLSKGAALESQPEGLLPPPVPLSPAPGSRLDHSNPRFSWRPRSAAASHTLEICRDPVCAELVARAEGVVAPRFQAEGLPLGELHYRVTARSESGLDGFPSAAVLFEIASLWRRPVTIR